METKKFLIVSTTGMGDCLWGTPGIRELKNAFPNAQIDLIVKKEWLHLFKHNPHLTNIYPYQNRWYAQLILGLKLILSSKFSQIFIFHANSDFSRMKVFLKSSPIWNHQGHTWCSKQFNLKSKWNEESLSFEKNLHAIERRLLILKEIGIEPKQSQMEIFFSDSEKKAFDIFLNRTGLKTPFVACHIGARSANRLWESKNFLTLTNLILKETSFNIVFGGNKNELEILKTIHLPESDRIFYSFNMSIINYAYLLSKATLLISNNTGPMHIGYAVKTPTIGIFQNVGNGHPDLVGPYKLNKTFYPVVSFLNGVTSVEKVWQSFQTICQATKLSQKSLKF